MSEMTREEVEKATHLRCVVGSTLHGLAIDGQDDRDEMGVCLEDVKYHTGLTSFEHYIYRTATERTGRNNAPSAPGDLDLTIYSLKKFCRLAANGNPNVWLLLFAPHEQCLIRTAIGAQLQEMAPAFLSQRIGAAYAGYMESQQTVMLSESRPPSRAALVEQYGYDTKAAMHLFRLGYQGIEMLTTGRVTLPMPEPQRSLVRSIRLGEVNPVLVHALANDLIDGLRQLRNETTWPEDPDWVAIDAYLQRTYWHWWKSRQLQVDLAEFWGNDVNSEDA